MRIVEFCAHGGSKDLEFCLQENGFRVQLGGQSSRESKMYPPFLGLRFLYCLSPETNFGVERVLHCFQSYVIKVNATVLKNN
jgi:hypothetical protein